MAKPPKQSDLGQAIAGVLASVAPQITDAVRDHLARLFGGDGASLGSGLSAKSSKTKGAGKAKGTKEQHTFPPHCLHPGCKNKQGGPRFSFLCEKHRDIPKAEKAKYMAAWRAKRSQHSGVKRATVKPEKKLAPIAKERAKIVAR